MADVNIDPEWTFEAVFLVAMAACPGPGTRSRGNRNAVLKKWASTVGRERAVGGLAEFRRRYPSKKAAAAALGISPDTFRRLELHFEHVRSLAKPGLTISFDTRLHRFDPAAFDMLIGEVLGRETDVTIEGRSNIDAKGPAFIRINGSRPEDLVAVAQAFYDRVWETAQDALEENALAEALSSGIAMILARLSHQRDHLVRIEENVGILAVADVRELLTDQGAGHVLAKDQARIRTRFQKLARAITDDAKRRLKVQHVVEVIEDEVGEALDHVEG